MKIGVLTEQHFDPTEFREFNRFFPENGVEVEYLSYLWGHPELTFGSNPDDDTVDEHVTVTKDVTTTDPAEYAGIILMGAYAMDRLRFQPEIAGPGARNTAPAVEFLRRAVATPHLRIGTICHSLWLFCADPDLLRGRKVTCAHNIVCDVENAGGLVQYEGGSTAGLVVDGNLVSARHSGDMEPFLRTFLAEIRSAHATV